MGNFCAHAHYSPWVSSRACARYLQANLAHWHDCLLARSHGEKHVCPLGAEDDLGLGHIAARDGACMVDLRVWIEYILPSS